MTSRETLPTASQLEREQLARLEFLSMLEATSLFALVCFAVPLKYLFQWPLGTRILGPIHGLTALAYAWTALQTVAAGDWARRDIVRLFIVAFIPFAGYWNAAWLRRKRELLMAQEPC